MNYRLRTSKSLPLLTMSALAMSAIFVYSPAIAAGHGAAAPTRGSVSRPMRPSMDSPERSREMPSRGFDTRARPSTTVERTETGITRTTTVTNGQGKTMTSTTTVTKDPATGTRSVETERTGFDGKTSSTSSVVQSGADGVTRTQSVTTPNGDPKNVVSDDATTSATDSKEEKRALPAKSPKKDTQK